MGDDADRNSVFPYDLSVAVLLVKEIEEKERERGDCVEREERSR